MRVDQAPESPPRWSDLYLVLVFALLIPLGRLLLDGFIFQRFARRLVLCPKLCSLDEKKLHKATESMWKLAYYLSSEVFVIYATFWEPWFASSPHYWENWPNDTMKFQVKLLFMYQCGFYVYSVVALLVWETRRKDFDVMMTHHLITIALIFSSYITGCYRPGSLVLALHDASDVLLELAKLMKYSGNDVGASVSFALFAASWLLLRLIYFPFWVIWSTSYDCMRFVDFTNVRYANLYYYLNSMLISLLVLHGYWWVLICRMALKQLQNNGKVGEDVRSDTDDD